LPDPLGRSLLLPAMVGISVSATPFLYAALAHLRRTAHAVGGGQIPAPAGSAADRSRSSGVSIAGSQKVVYDEISDVTTQSLAGRKVEEKMHTGKDAAQRCFFCGSRKACK
jgi:hypothetical protein